MIFQTFNGHAMSQFKKIEEADHEEMKVVSLATRLRSSRGNEAQIETPKARKGPQQGNNKPNSLCGH
jgi:hypothetical protein